MTQLAIDRITAQQVGREGTAPWMVGEQLKDICQREPESAELIAQDLENPDMTLDKAERKIKAYADAHKSGNFACVTPDAAERILREFYGLPEPGRQEALVSAPIAAPAPAPARGKVLNYTDFL